MTTPRRPKPPEADSTKRQGAWHASSLYLALALTAIAGGVALLVYGVVSPSASAPAVAPVLRSSKSDAVVVSPQHTAAAANARAPHEAPSKEGDNDPTRDLSSYVMRGEKPTMNHVIDRLHQEGIHTGLGAFNPPGTRPNLVGLAVPENFALPPGYVRHHQSTDDGQTVEAILMFAPDVQLFNAAHEPIAIPKNRVVPPELAPPGMPIRRIVIPAPIAAGSAGS